MKLFLSSFQVRKKDTKKEEEIKKTLQILEMIPPKIPFTECSGDESYRHTRKVNNKGSLED